MDGLQYLSALAEFLLVCDWDLLVKSTACPLSSDPLDWYRRLDEFHETTVNCTEKRPAAEAATVLHRDAVPAYHARGL